VTFVDPPWPPGTDDAYRATSQPRVVSVPELLFLMVDGTGDPATSASYTDAIETLYAVAYAARFDLKRTGGVDAKVRPLEGIWWTEAAGDVWASRASWRWTMMIAQPEAVTDAVLQRARSVAARKRGPQSLDRVRLERFAEGVAAQLLHMGPYGDAERPSVERLHAFIHEQGFSARGRHHEIYLSDARRTAPDRLRTILRQPVSRMPAGDRVRRGSLLEPEPRD
jgi:hypothetical protein